MNTKLTLTLEKEIIEEAKKYASKKGISLSEMMGNYSKYIIEPNTQSATSEELSPRVQNLRGVLKVGSSFNYKNNLNKARNQKHGI